MSKDWATNPPALQTVIQLQLTHFLSDMTASQTVRALSGLAGMNLHVDRLGGDLQRLVDEVISDKMESFTESERAELLFRLMNFT
jgi:hypothetical protein